MKQRNVHLLLLFVLTSPPALAGDWYADTPDVMEHMQRAALVCAADKPCAVLAKKLQGATAAAVCGLVQSNAKDTLAKADDSRKLYQLAVPALAVQIGPDHVPGCAQQYLVSYRSDD